MANVKGGEVGRNHEDSELQICRAEAAKKLNVSERTVNAALNQPLTLPQMAC